MPTINVLVINPNSNEGMTDDIKHAPLAQPEVEYHFFMNLNGPQSIDNEHDCHQSAESCMEALLDPASGVDMDKYDGFVVACYSLHPLVRLLRSATGKPVVGIFEASVTTCLHLMDTPQRFGIVSTGKIWESLLAEGVSKILGTIHPGCGERFAGVAGIGLTAGDLTRANPEQPQQLIKNATKRLLRENRNQGIDGNLVGAIALGCAAMSSLQAFIRDACIEELGEEQGSRIYIIDGVRAAIGVVLGLIRSHPL